MRFFWVDCRAGRTWTRRKSLVTTALESGASGVVIRPEDREKAEVLGNITIVSVDRESDVVLVGPGGEGDGSLELPASLSDSKDLSEIKRLKGEGRKTAGLVEIRGKGYERLAALEARDADYIVVVGRDWEVIPLENLIAELQKEDVKILAGVKTAEQARTAFETLEIGVDGVLLQTGDVNTIKKVSRLVAGGVERLGLKVARIRTVRPVSMGDRVCIDTASLLQIGEGMLIGSQANGLFLVHSETLESEYVASRPFRVNAGAVHAYVLVPGGKTMYLSDLKAGDEVLAVDREGNTRTVVVGRVKIEKRPLMLIEAEIDGRIYKTLLQNAETINLVGKDGRPISVSRLKKGDEVLLYTKDVGRHFGMEVEESLIER
ncbi:MAG: 3-dehydroquinate synthase II [Methanobacteriota archaeon]|nr:MAG: 3-dehydroquinate synthase II [Euryarchaeota archaeon]